MKRGAPLSRNTPLTARTPLRTHAGFQAPALWSRSVPLLTTTKSAATARRGLTSWVPPQPAGVDPARKTAARTRTGFSRKVKLQVRTRAGNGRAEDAMCEACGFGLGRRHGECQHLVARGMGGTSNPLLSTAANAALLCRDCHRIAESRDREMGARGFWLPQGTDPRMVPMTLAGEHGSGALVWRSEDGRYLFEAPEGAAA